MRNVGGKGYRSHTDPLFSRLKIMKFEDLHIFNCCTFMHKLINGKAPPSFNNTFIPLAVPNRTNSFQTDKEKSKFLAQFPTHFLPKIWNCKPLELKLTRSHASFKNSLEDSLISKYSSHIKCNSASCPDCR